MTNVDQRIHHGAINVMFSGPGSGVTRDMLRRGRRVRAVAIRLVGVDTGLLRASIEVDVVHKGGIAGVRIGSRLPYARLHHDGHGMIIPHRAKMLSWQAKNGRQVFARRVGPVRGTHFLTRALPAARL